MALLTPRLLRPQVHHLIIHLIGKSKRCGEQRCAVATKATVVWWRSASGVERRQRARGAERIVRERRHRLGFSLLGDDCIAINNGSSFINITNIACGPGHGISVGSLGESGSYQTAEEILVRNCSFNGTQNGARIKTWQGGSGYARKISFEHIILTDVKRPIIIDQRYTCQECASSAITVSDVSYSYIQGTSANEEAIVFDCAQTPGCTNIVMNQINITSADPSQKISAICSNANGTYSTTVPQVPCLKEINGTSFNLYT